MTDNISELAVQFENVFGVKLAKYWLGPYRLDITKFDDEVVHSGELSVADAIREEWGDGAVDLVRALL
jgi:hypothetical protein